MKKYVYRKQTPLKWNTFLKYFVLPVFILSEAFQLYSMFSELTGFNLPFASDQLGALLNMLGVKLDAPGDYLWFLIGWVVYNLIVFILTAYAWIGLLKWKGFGYKALLVTYLFSVFWWGLLCYFLTTDLFMVIIYAFAYLYAIDMKLLKTLCIVAIVFGMIFALLQLLLTAIYYHKRKALFDTYYQEPYNMNTAPVSNDAINPSAQEIKKTAPEMPVHDDVNTNESTSSEETTDPQTIHAEENINEEAASLDTTETKADSPLSDSDKEADHVETTDPQQKSQEETVAEEVKETQKKIKTNFCPQCGARIENQDMKFCGNCGHAL